MIENKKKGYFQKIPVKELNIFHKLNLNKPFLFTETNRNFIKQNDELLR